MRTMGVIAAFAAVLMLAGCASGERAVIAKAASVADASLTDTKASVQLLRNEAADRLPAIIVEQELDRSDGSEACLDTETDPDGLARSWRSTTTILVVNSQAARVQTVTDEVAATFVDIGWEPATSSTAEGTVTTLTKRGSLARIELSVSPKSTDQRPAVRISVVGPCVMTPGGESDEVRHLEKRI